MNTPKVLACYNSTIELHNYTVRVAADNEKGAIVTLELRASFGEVWGLSHVRRRSRCFHARMYSIVRRELSW